MNQTKFNPNFSIFLIFLLVFTFTSCADDEAIPVDPPEEETSPIDIGSFTLLEESIEALPYADKSKAVFVDSLGNQAIFDIMDNGIFENEGSILFRYDVNEPGDTVRYSYNSQTKVIILNNDSLAMNLTLILKSQPYAPDPESGALADVLNIYCKNPNNPSQAYQVFYHETNPRTYPTSWNGDLFPEITFLDSTFTDVHFINFTDPKSILYFNYEFGIVSFTDAEGDLWRYETLE